MKAVLHFCWILFFAVVFALPSYGTHLRAGQITAVRDAARPNTLTYIFTLTLYLDTKGVDQPDAELVLVPLVNGQRRTEIDRVRANANAPRRTVGPGIEEITYTFRYTFPGAGQYVIYFQEENRNPEIVNMTNSVNTPFYVETILTINQSLGLNNTPVLLNPPIDAAEVGQRFCHNPAAFDPDGDSLAYRLAIPALSAYQLVTDYKFPHQVGPPAGVPESGSGVSTFAVNPLTGDLCWDAPGAFGIGSKGYAVYSMALVVEEWRKANSGYIKLGEIVRDMQVVVWSQANKRPALVIPKDTILVAGAAITVPIRASDPDSDQQVRISSESAMFSTVPGLFPAQPLANLSINNYPPKLPGDYVFQGNPTQNQFGWQTSCEQVRNQPYDIVFKAEDNATSSILADVKTWRIFIIGTPPANVQAKTGTTNQTMEISWSAYTCNTKAKLYIWRRDGCGSKSPGAYSMGTPAGYTLLGKVNATATAFTDHLAKPGVAYSYLVSASMENNIHSLGTPTSCSTLSVSVGAPVVTITAPVNDASFMAPAAIAVSVNATDSDGTIAKVELYSNGTKIGEDNTAPYSFDWKDVPFGKYTLTAKAFDNTGASSLSTPVGITVTDIVNGSEEDEENILLAYPNPFYNEIRVRYTRPIRQLTLINLLGVTTELSYQPMGNYVYAASIESLPPGVYVLRIRNERGKVLLRKLVKQ
jgi:hypothetical protein